MRILTSFIAAALFVVPGCTSDSDRDPVDDDVVGDPPAEEPIPETEDTDTPTDSIEALVRQGQERGAFVADAIEDSTAGAHISIQLGRGAGVLLALHDVERQHLVLAAETVGSETAAQYADDRLIAFDAARSELDQLITSSEIIVYPSTAVDWINLHGATDMETLRASHPDAFERAFLELEVMILARDQVIADELWTLTDSHPVGVNVQAASDRIDEHMQVAIDLLLAHYD